MGRKSSLLDWTIRHNRYVMLGEPRQQVQFGASPDQIVEDLIGHAAIPARSDKLFHIVGIEIADTPVSDLSCRFERLQCLHCLSERHRSPPMEQVEVQPVGAEPLQARLARTGKARARCVLRTCLADEEQLVANAAQRLGYQRFGRTIAVHFGRIDQRHAQFDTGT